MVVNPDQPLAKEVSEGQNLPTRRRTKMGTLVRKGRGLV